MAATGPKDMVIRWSIVPGKRDDQGIKDLQARSQAHIYPVVMVGNKDPLRFES
jgi:hypothetical protein